MPTGFWSLGYLTFNAVHFGEIIEEKWGRSPINPFFVFQKWVNRATAPFFESEPLDRNRALILRNPLLEVLQLRIQLACDVRAAHPKDLFFEMPIDLEHVAHYLGARKSEAAIDIRVDGVVFHGAD